MRTLNSKIASTQNDIPAAPNLQKLFNETLKIGNFRY